MAHLRNGKNISKENNNNSPLQRTSEPAPDIKMKLFERKLDEHRELIAEQLKLLEERIMQRFSAISASIMNLSTDVNKLARRVDNVEATCKKVDNEVDQLKAKISALENNAVDSDVVIRNVPNHLDASAAVSELFSAISFANHPSRVFRVNKNLDSSNSVPIIVKLQSPLDRSKLFRSIAEFRKKHKRQLSASDCGSNGDINIVVHECITTFNRHILSLALNYKNKKLLHSVFTLRGWVHVRVKENSKAVKIFDVATLSKIVGGTNANT